jgi:hypothetical protein
VLAQEKGRKVLVWRKVLAQEKGRKVLAQEEGVGPGGRCWAGAKVLGRQDVLPPVPSGYDGLYTTRKYLGMFRFGRSVFGTE